jgi:hypothetical protein
VLDSIFKKKNPYFGTKTFTYYIPAPPLRRTGYQEKEFDNVIATITGMGFEIIDIKLSSHGSESKSGLWVVCLLGAKTKNILSQNILLDTTDPANISSTQDVPLDPDIIHD